MSQGAPPKIQKKQIKFASDDKTVRLLTPFNDNWRDDREDGGGQNS
jgi:hypothetical protein